MKHIINISGSDGFCSLCLWSLACVYEQVQAWSAETPVPDGFRTVLLTESMPRAEVIPVQDSASWCTLKL